MARLAQNSFCHCITLNEPINAFKTPALLQKAQNYYVAGVLEGFLLLASTGYNSVVLQPCLAVTFNPPSAAFLRREPADAHRRISAAMQHRAHKTAYCIYYAINTKLVCVEHIGDDSSLYRGCLSYATATLNVNQNIHPLSNKRLKGRLIALEHR